MPHTVFISYHHGGDAAYKEELLALNRRYNIFYDGSVNTRDIDDRLPDQRIRQIIRDDYLRDTTVTIVLVGTGTWGRKHVDWEIYSSMFDGRINKKSGILVIMLPTTGCTNFHAVHAGEKERVYPECGSWTEINTRSEYEQWSPYMPARLIDNLIKNEARVSVTTWNTIYADPSKLQFLIDAAWKDRTFCEYDLSRPMRRNNA
jgi:hypothetical protein